tara:strand:- start:203 stop:451 length:249 start_codon:yes stop_codon:yes gene_type:complete
MMEDVLIVAIIFGALFGGRIIKLVLDHRKEVKKLEIKERSQLNTQDKDALQHQVEDLKHRVEVLERIVTDNKYQIEKEIASL